MALFIYLNINLKIIAVQKKKKKKEETPDLYFSDQTRFD